MRQLMAGWTALVAASMACADVIELPGPEASLQAAIESASDGDIVLVDPGTHDGPFDLGDRRIVPRSTDGAGLTILRLPRISRRDRS